MTKKTMTDLAKAYCQSSGYRELSDGSKEKYRRALVDLMMRFKRRPIDKISRSEIILMRDNMANEPGKANMALNVLSAAMSYAADIGWVQQNPCLGVKRLKMGEHSPWDDASIEKFKKDSVGLARRAFYLGYYTGQRISDIIHIRKDNVDFKAEPPRINLIQKKTGERVSIPIHPELREEMRKWGLSSGKYVYLLGLECSYSYFYRVFVKECERLGVNETFHGLRKNMAKRLAEAGASEREIMAITGHLSTKMVSHYTKGADQATRAVRAMEKI